MKFLLSLIVILLFLIFLELIDAWSFLYNAIFYGFICVVILIIPVIWTNQFIKDELEDNWLAHNTLSHKHLGEKNTLIRIFMAVFVLFPFLLMLEYLIVMIIFDFIFGWIDLRPFVDDPPRIFNQH